MPRLRPIRPRLFFAASALLFFIALAEAADEAVPTLQAGWPTFTQDNRPWTRWWWQGDAVDGPNLKRSLSAFQEVGFGGIEVCPIYGVKGGEGDYLPYLSKKWIEMISLTGNEAVTRGLGFDLTTGTGWPLGGPWIKADSASQGVVLKKYTLAGGVPVELSVIVPGLQCLVGVDAEGHWIDLTARVQGEKLSWQAPAGIWRLYAVGSRPVLQQVKRAAPGGEGNVIDPFSVAALDRFLKPIDEAFKKYTAAPPRAQFHDSYEYFGANWTGDFLQEFSSRRGYDLRSELPGFFGEGNPETAARIRDDYRQTISELHQAFVAHWTAWSHAHGSLAREQAHGSPTNLEDVYATVDIPETEGSFAGVDNTEKQLPMMQFASSAAHVSGRTLASSETFTWLGEHFRVPLAKLKPAVDFFFLAGINHIFLHGIPYSPQEAPWPGWEFYAAVNFGPNGGLWHDLPAFNAYVTRCQSMLQSGRPDNDLLLYFPVHDFWQKGGDTVTEAASASSSETTLHGLVEQFSTPGQWMVGTPFHDTAMKLWLQGFSYDEVTDHFIAAAAAQGGDLLLGGNSYRAIFLPPTQWLPVETLRQLVALARGGATIVFQGSLPTGVPGLSHLAERQREFDASLATIKLEAIPGTGIRRAIIGEGRVLVGSDVSALLAQAGISREPMTDLGLRCLRRRESGSTSYFIVNSGTKPVDDWVELETAAASAVILDPLYEDRFGLAAIRPGHSGATQVYLQLQPGESRIVRLSDSRGAGGSPWPYASRASGASRTLEGVWRVHFVEGGPALPSDFQTEKLGSWTARDDPEAKRFAGTAVYTLDFDFKPSGAGDWRLDLGRLSESARVRLNGQRVATLWCPPYSVLVGKFLRPGSNHLEVEVTNVAANRIADLDRRRVPWKIFNDINVVGLDYQPFDASAWPVMDSGLLGPVTLDPTARLRP